MKFLIKHLRNYSLILSVLFFSSLKAEEEEIYLKALSDQIQVITKDIQTLEKAVYQSSDVALKSKSNLKKTDGLNEDILTTVSYTHLTLPTKA